jgi:hypothetical protein
MKSYSSEFKNIITILIIGFVLFPATTSAAILYLEPSSREYQPGDTFIVEMKIDTEGECINTIEANLSFSRDILKAVDFSQGKSIIIVWVKSPEINQEKGEISFSGGISGGYCGRIPGDPGTSNLLGQIIFRIPGMMVRKPGENIAEVKFLDTSQILLNDGLGTKAKLTTQGATFKILSKLEPSQDEWKEELEKDNIPPEPFEIEIQQTPAIFEGKYFITFSTTDKQTGVDYYEIREGKRDWQTAESPYLLDDQSLQSIIEVKAIDKAGNERIAEYTPEIPKKPFLYWVIILVLIGAGVIWWIIKRIKK